MLSAAREVELRLGAGAEREADEDLYAEVIELLCVGVDLPIEAGTCGRLVHAGYQRCIHCTRRRWWLLKHAFNDAEVSINAMLEEHASDNDTRDDGPGTLPVLDDLSDLGDPCLRRNSGDLHAEVVQTPEEPLGDAVLVAILQVPAAEVVVVLLVAKHEVGGGQHGGGDRDDRLLRAAPALEAPKLGLQVAPLLPRRRPRGLHQHRLQPRVRVTDPGRATLARTLVQTRAQAPPTRPDGPRWKTASCRCRPRR